MNRILIFLVRCFNPVWKMMGVDLNQFYAILNAKLKVDGRRKTSMFGGAALSDGSFVFKGLLFFVLFCLGSLLLLLFGYLAHTPTALTIYLMIWMVLLSMSIVTDYTDILIDTKDNYTILPTPISGTTFSTARMVRILILLFKQTFAFILPALIYFGITKPLGLFLFFFLSFLVTLMSLCLVSIIYLLAMRYSSPQRFKTALNYIQISLTVLTFGAYYLLPELFDKNELQSLNIFESPYSYFVPTAWIAAIWEFVFNGNSSSKIILHIALALLGTGGAFLYIAKYLSSNYSQRLFSVGQGQSGDKEKAPQQLTEKSNGWLDRLANISTFNIEEKALFKFCFRITGRDRMFKLKTYPVIGYVPIFLLGMFLKGEGSLADRFLEIQASSQYFFIVYGAIFIAAVPLLNSRFSEKPEQTWVFHANPLARPQEIFKALFKVLFIKFLFPFWMFFFLVSMLIWGPMVVDEFLFGLLVLTMLNLLEFRIMSNQLPFSQPWSEQQGGEQMSVFFGFSILLGAVGGFHYYCREYTLVLLGSAVLSILVIAFLWRSFASVRVKL